MSVIIYTDESGTHNNRYMVICALITTDDVARKRIKRVLRKTLAKYRKTKPNVDELHASKLSTTIKQDVLLSLSKQHDFQIAYLVCDKNHLIPELKSRSNLCYNYLFNILFKKIVTKFSAYDITIIADNRTVSAGSKNSLPEYIMTEAYAKWGYKGNLKLEFLDSRDSKALQAVDIIANSIYAKYDLNKEHLYSFHSGHCIEIIRFPYKKFGS